MAKHNEIGKIGEDIARTFLMKHGFSIIETNLSTKYGETDIIATKDKTYHFVEVKSIKVNDFNNIDTLKVRPEDNFTKEKQGKCRVSAQIYMQKVKEETSYQIDLACVYIVEETKQGRVHFFQNVLGEYGE